MRFRGVRPDGTGGDIRSTAWCWYLVAAVPVAMAYFILPTVPAKLIVWPALGWSSVAAIAVGRPVAPARRPHRVVPAARRRRHVHRRRRPLQLPQLRAGHAPPPFPSYVDLVYLAVYPLLTVGLVLLVRKRTPGRDRGSVLDAAIITVGLGLLSWVVLIVPYLREPGHDPARTAHVDRLPRGRRRACSPSPCAWPSVPAADRSPSGCSPGSIVPLLAADALVRLHEPRRHLARAQPRRRRLDPLLRRLGSRRPAPVDAQAVAARRRARPALSARRLVLVGSAALIPPAVLLRATVAWRRHRRSRRSRSRRAILFAARPEPHGRAGPRRSPTTAARPDSGRWSNNASDAIIVVDDDGRIRYQTPSAERVLGRDAVELLDQPIGELLEADDERQLGRPSVHRRRDDDRGVAGARWRRRARATWRSSPPTFAD